MARIIFVRVENFRQMWESVDWQFNALATISQILISIDNQIWLSIDNQIWISIDNQIWISIDNQIKISTDNQIQSCQLWFGGFFPNIKWTEVCIESPSSKDKMRWPDLARPRGGNQPVAKMSGRGRGEEGRWGWGGGGGGGGLGGWELDTLSRVDHQARCGHH